MDSNGPKYFAHKIQQFVALPKYYGGTGNEHDQAKADARALAFGELAEYMQDGITYSVKRTEEVRAPNADDEDVFGVFVVTLTTIAIIDTLL